MKTNRTEKYKDLRNQLLKEKDDFNKNLKKELLELQYKNERIQEEITMMKNLIEINEIMINFIKELVEFDG